MKKKNIIIVVHKDRLTKNKKVQQEKTSPMSDKLIQEDIKEQKKKEIEEQKKKNRELIFSPSEYDSVEVVINLADHENCTECSQPYKTELKRTHIGAKPQRIKVCHQCKRAVINFSATKYLHDDIYAKAIFEEKAKIRTDKVRAHYIETSNSHLNANSLKEDIYLGDKESRDSYNFLKIGRSIVTKAWITVLTPDGSKLDVSINLYYDIKREVYYMLNTNMRKVLLKGIPLCRILSKKHVYINNNFFTGHYVTKVIYSPDCEKFFAEAKHLENQITLFEYGKNNVKLVKIKANQCFNDDSKLIDINGKTKILQEDGTMKDVSFLAAYCIQCGRFYIHESVYNSLRKQGILQCSIISPSHSLSNAENSVIEWNEESILHLYGYNVNSQENLTNEQRQAILYNIVKSKKISRFEIVDHLGFLIQLNKDKVNFNSAIAKWKMDAEFVNSIDIEEIKEEEVEAVRVVKNLNGFKRDKT